MASLQELPDDELDKLFRASAEEFDPPYNPSDWADLRQRLDQDSGRPFYYRLLFWGLPLLLLLITGVSVLYQQTKPVLPVVAGSTTSLVDHPTTATEAQERAGRPTGLSAPQGNQRAEQSASSSAQGTVDPSGEETAAESATGNLGNVPVSDISKINEPSMSANGAIAANRSRPNVSANESTVRPTRRPTRSSTHQQTTNLSSIGRPEVATPSVARQPNVVASKRPKRTDSETSSTNSSSTDASDPAELERALNNPDAGAGRPRRRSRNGVAVDPSATIPNGSAYRSSETPSNAGDHLLNPIDNRFALTPDPAILAARSTKRRSLRLPTLQFDPAPELLSDADQLKAPVVAYPSHPSVSIRLVGAPDLNFVNRGHKPASSLGFGILGEYRFLERFTIQSGVLRSVKRYTVPAAEYPKIPHWYGPKYESVGAECTVLDIPINLRFDVLKNDQRRWFISSGVSSYIMQREVYTYNYPAYIPPPTQLRYQQWLGKTGLFKFSHLNLSFGYERRFRATGPLQRFSWQVEPFLKAPLRKVGWGNFRLTSTGALFSIRYRL